MLTVAPVERPRTVTCESREALLAEYARILPPFRSVVVISSSAVDVFSLMALRVARAREFPVLVVGFNQPFPDAPRVAQKHFGGPESFYDVPYPTANFGPTPGFLLDHLRQQFISRGPRWMEWARYATRSSESGAFAYRFSHWEGDYPQTLFELVPIPEEGER